MSTIVVSEKKEKFLQSLEEGFGVSGLLDATEGLEIPHRRTERWKYTRVNKLVAAHWKRGVSELSGVSELNPFSEIDAIEIYLVNGQVAATSGDLPEGLTIESEHSEEGFFQDKNIFSAVNYALCNVSVHITAERNQLIEKPVHLIHVHTGKGVGSFSRVQVSVERGASLQVIQSFVSDGGSECWINHINEMEVKENARLSVTKWQEINEESWLMLHENTEQGADATYTSTMLTDQGGLVRNDSRVALNGKNGEANLFGTYQPKGKEQVDNYTTIDHKVPHCNSNELYKGVIHDAATGVFNGKVFVREDAQLTNAFQQNSNIVLTENGTMNSKPELEIYADDVKCSHGSTTGQFDEDALFYLKARGISEMSAKEMLVQAFMQEVIDEVEFEEIKTRMISDKY